MLNNGQSSSYLQFDLQPGTPVSLWGTEGCDVQCLHGRVWITEENGGEDICLEAGQKVHLTHPGQTVVAANDRSGEAQCRLYQIGMPEHMGRLGRWIHAWVTGLTVGGAMARRTQGHGVGMTALF